MMLIVILSFSFLPVSKGAKKIFSYPINRADNELKLINSIFL
jgi:hypothetical protein